MNLALFSGLLLALCFPNLFDKEIFAGQGILAWMALVPLLLSLKGLGPKAAFRHGFWAGFLFFLLSLYWIHFVQPMGPGVWPAWLALSAYLALYPAAFAWGTALGLGRGWKFEALWIPALWTVLEYGRESLLTGYPWVSLGSSQSLNFPLLPIVSVTGIYGLHFAVALGNVLLWQALRKQAWPAREKIAALAAVLLVLGLRLAAQPRPLPSTTLRVAVLQPNIDEDQDQTPAYRRQMMEAYGSLMQEALRGGAKAMIMPESGFPGIFNAMPPEARALVQFAKAHQVCLVIGSVVFGSRLGSYANAAVFIDAQGNTSAYLKRHLVPFGEVIPFRDSIPLLDSLLNRAGFADFEAGQAPSLFESGNYRSSPLVCYESIFGSLAREASQGAITLITLDSWFGDSAAPRHHLQQAVFRAVEGGRWVARSAATGISAFVSPQGRIVSSLPLNSAGMLLQDMDCESQDTFYLRHGAWWPWACLGFLALTAFFSRKRT